MLVTDLAKSPVRSIRGVPLTVSLTVVAMMRPLNCTTPLLYRRRPKFSRCDGVTA